MVPENYEELHYVASLEGLNLKNHGETIGHCIRCSLLASLFGCYIGLDAEELKLLELCGLLHDIGKFRIQPELLYKVGRLNANEIKIIKNHATYKFRRYENEVVQESVNYHHERCDGNGYFSRTYDTISKFTKIITIIDTYDAMLNTRSYRNGNYSISYIYKEIEKNLGTQFDEYYGRLFLRMLRGKNYVG